MVKPRYLLDTNILSEPLRPQPDSSVMKQLERHYHEVATAAVVWHELRFGCCRLPVSRKRHRIEQYLNEVVLPYLSLLPYDQAAADWHAEERARLSGIGLAPPFADGQIAAIAKTHNLIVVTANIADFEHFSDIIVENWFLSESGQEEGNEETSSRQESPDK
ncbi:PIN domain-containing protein [Candidatus Electrothrix sp.]|uniref:PIN domain-containing protein n=1 Tax=Candidatus Electrothrix sp. TaxID=2170559 RepID=UPI00405634AF